MYTVTVDAVTPKDKINFKYTCDRRWYELIDMSGSSEDVVLFNATLQIGDKVKLRCPAYQFPLE